ncbi:MAG: putative lipid II flippase FtsW [Clostridia bacterium]|nr:putative lipid II flippase FtsW [Clostridia bacterium]
MKKFNFKQYFIIQKPKKADGLSIAVICLTLFLCVLGCIMVYSASSYSALKNYGNSYFFLTKQIAGVLIGLVCLAFFYFFDSDRLKKLKWLFFAVAVIGLVLVFVPGIGASNYGATRWIKIAGISFQPSELAKFALVLFCASYMSENYKKVKSFKSLLLPLFIGGVLCLLVILEPNMSVTMCLGLTLITMLIIGGISKKHFLALALPATALVPALIIIEPYRIKRLMAFIDPWANPQGEGFQLIQSLYALGNGGLFGVGLFNSRQKYLFLPFSESDFIFSIIGEELGLFGAGVVVFAFVALVICLIKIALNAKDRFGALLCAGFASLIAIQVAINIAVVTGSIPPTGIPLPFISAGSSALMIFLGMIGVCLNVRKKSLLF